MYEVCMQKYHAIAGSCYELRVRPFSEVPMHVACGRASVLNPQ